jgi:Protein of unknown function (DUF4238)
MSHSVPWLMQPHFRSEGVQKTVDRYTAQIVRTKMVRTTMRSIAEQMLAALSDTGIDPGEVDGLSIPTDQEVRRAALASFLALRRIIGAIQEKRPLLIHSSNSQVFWISDNPVVFHNTFPYGERALNAPRIEVYFPISSELVLGFFCPSVEVEIQQLLSLDHPGIDRQKYSEISRGLQGGDAVSLGPETVPFSTRFRFTTLLAFSTRQAMSLSMRARFCDVNLKRETYKPWFQSDVWARDLPHVPTCLPAYGSFSMEVEVTT